MRHHTKGVMMLAIHLSRKEAGIECVKHIVAPLCYCAGRDITGNHSQVYFMSHLTTSTIEPSPARKNVRGVTCILISFTLFRLCFYLCHCDYEVLSIYRMALNLSPCFIFFSKSYKKGFIKRETSSL